MDYCSELLAHEVGVEMRSEKSRLMGMRKDELVQVLLSVTAELLHERACRKALERTVWMCDVDLRIRAAQARVTLPEHPDDVPF